MGHVAVQHKTTALLESTYSGTAGATMAHGPGCEKGELPVFTSAFARKHGYQAFVAFDRRQDRWQ